MPIYEYDCKPCKESKELLQKLGSPPPACPKCHKPMDKKISRTSFALKGGGWADDGYAG